MENKKYTFSSESTVGELKKILNELPDDIPPESRSRAWISFILVLLWGMFALIPLFYSKVLGG